MTERQFEEICEILESISASLARISESIDSLPSTTDMDNLIYEIGKLKPLTVQTASGNTQAPETVKARYCADVSEDRF